MTRLKPLPPMHCPRCKSTDIADGRSRLVVVLGLACLLAGTLALILSYRSPYTEDWSYFVPLASEDPLGLVVLAYGIVLVWGGAHTWDRVTCLHCGYKWEPDDPAFAPRPSHRHWPTGRSH